jgi:hypothetical protein
MAKNYYSEDVLQRLLDHEITMDLIDSIDISHGDLLNCTIYNTTQSNHDYFDFDSID